MAVFHTIEVGIEVFCLYIFLVICFQSLSSATPLRDDMYFYRFTARNGTATICLSCPPGTYLVKECTSPRTTGQCLICPVGYFQPTFTNARECMACATKCTHINAESSQAVCESTKNFCACGNNTCILDVKCPPGKQPALQATSYQHKICEECPEDTYSDVYSSTDMCKPLTKCGPQEVAILDGDSTQDRVCEPRKTFYDSSVKNDVAIVITTPSLSESDTSTNPSIVYVVVVPLVIAFTLFVFVLFIIKRYHWKYRNVRRDGDIPEELFRLRDLNTPINETKLLSRSSSDLCTEPVDADAPLRTDECINKNSNPAAPDDVELHIPGSVPLLSSIPTGQRPLSIPLNQIQPLSSPEVSDIPCPKHLDVSRENTKALPKLLDGKCKNWDWLRDLNTPINETKLLSRSSSDLCTEPLDADAPLRTDECINKHSNPAAPDDVELDNSLIPESVPLLTSLTTEQKPLSLITSLKQNERVLSPEITNIPCSKHLDVSRENTKALPKVLDDPCENMDTNILKPHHGPSNKTEASPSKVRKHFEVLYSRQTKTILSTDWQRCIQVTNQGCILQLPNSDVITTFPPGVLADGGPCPCYKTVHTDIPRISTELRLQDDSVITSPVPEYSMQSTFAKFVQIQIPHRMPKNYKHIKIHSFSKNLDCGTVDLVELKRFEDESTVDEDIDMFYTVTAAYVVVYTKHFSGFVCTTCRRYIEYKLSASVYGRKGLMDGRTDTLDVLLYLKGAKSSITDFRVVMEKKIDKRFHHLESKEMVNLLKEHEQREGGQLQFRFCLVSESVRTWVHRKANDGEQIQHDLILVDPEALMSHLETHIICSEDTKWYLQREEETCRNCDFYVEIVHKEKPASALDTLCLVKTYIPACVNFEASGAVVAASEQGEPIPGPITDIVMTLKDHLNEQDSLKLVKHMGCLQNIPPKPDRRQREDFRYDYWYNAFLACFYHLKDDFINRVKDGLKKMGHTNLEALVCVHAPENRSRIAPVPANRHPSRADGSHIGQPSSAEEHTSSDKRG